MLKHFFAVINLGIILFSCSAYKGNSNQLKIKNKIDMDTITLGAGCFWCVEAIFQDLKGVKSVVSGYSGGTVNNPTYKEVCTGSTGHAEVCQVVYDSKVIALPQLLEVFWQVHDPTTLNRQGGDVGTQYRSVIFYHNAGQKKIATEYLTKLNAAKVFENPIVTEITAFTQFFSAENYHQDYFNLNGENPYCSAVIKPKLEKFKKVFAELLK